MKKKAVQAATVIEDILCDICGASVIPSEVAEHIENANGFSDYAKLSASFGYGSERDGDEYHLDFCESCFESVQEKVRELQRIRRGS